MPRKKKVEPINVEDVKPIDVKEHSLTVKNQIRCIVSNVYDIQKLRISSGNRLVQSFYIRLGITPSTSPEDADKESQSMIKTLKEEYTRITDAVAANKKGLTKASVRQAIEELNKQNESENLKFIKDNTDMALVDSYMKLLESEESLVKTLDTYVKEHPLWDKFFKDIKGCGTLMSAVCIAYLDPYVAKYPSSFFKYCGLDTVQDTDAKGNPIFLEKVNGVVQNKKVIEKFLYMDEDGIVYTGDDIVSTDEYDSEGNLLFKSKSTGAFLYKDYEYRNVNGEDVQVYEEIDGGAEYIGEVVISQHARRKGDTEMVEYVAADGTKQMKRSITYNPIVKTKLMGVLPGCLIKAKDPKYEQIYRDYKARLDNSAKCKDYTAGHKNMMAQRYMIKSFIRDLHTTWRELEGLPIYEPYEVAKLGHKPHHLNEEQYLKAQAYKEAHNGSEI